MAPSEALNTDYKACVAFDTGGLGDKGFNDLAKKGLDDAAALGFKTQSAEAQGSTDYEGNIQRLIDAGCQTIITVGFLQGSATAKATLANPNIAFGQVDATWNSAGDDFTPGTADDPPPGVPANFTGLDYQVDQAAMLAGYLAASYSKTGKVGTYGGLAFPGVTRFMDGWYARRPVLQPAEGQDRRGLGWDGSQKDPTTTGTFVGGSGGNDTWNDPAKGEQFAKTFLDQGVDIVHPVAGETGNGTIKAMLAARQVGRRRRQRSGDHPARLRRRDPDVAAEGHRRLGPRRDQEDLGWRPRWRGLLGHARQQRRAPVPVPRVRQPDPGRDQGGARYAEGGDRRRQRQGLHLPRHAAARQAASVPRPHDRPRPATRTGGGLHSPAISITSRPC